MRHREGHGRDRETAPLGELAPGDLAWLATFSLDPTTSAEILGVNGVHPVSAWIGVYGHEATQVTATQE